MRRLMVLFGAGILLFMGLAAPAHAAVSPSTVTVFESYACASEPPQSTVSLWGCNGTWWSANPNQRSVNINVDPVTVASTGFRTTSIRSAASLDGQPHVLRGYCSYPNGTTSGQRWSVQVGGNHPNSYNFGGLNTCPSGVNGGLWIVMTGWYGGSAGYTGNVHYNDWTSGAGRMSCSCDYIG